MFHHARCGAVAVLACALTIPATAQEIAILESQVAGNPGEKFPPTQLKLAPAKATVPALKYRFLPELRDLKPGNAAMLYYRAFSPEWQVALNQPSIRKAFNKYSENPDQMPPEELRYVLLDNSLKEIDLAARRTYCDWEMLDRLRKDGIAMLLPDIQSFRTYIRLLAARARFELMDKKFDKALYTLQTGFTFSRHVGDGPTLIQALVGLAMAQQMVMEVEHLIQQPGAPNLYWALTDLPAPYIDMRKPLQGEKLLMDSLFPGMRELVYGRQAKIFSKGELEGIVDKLVDVGDVLAINRGKESEWQVRMGLAFLASQTYPEAKKNLIEMGWPAAVVNKMPVTQVAIFHEVFLYDQLYDDMAKWYGMPYPIMRKGIAKAEENLKLQRVNAFNKGGILATLLLPAVVKVTEASYRIDRKIAGLRCVEAIRMYAAAHEGKLPGTLKDITEVPLPIDPHTVNPFQYEVKGNVATLTAPPLPGKGPLVGTDWSIEITMQPGN